MTERDFSVVAVIGLGTMGAGIVEVFARKGHRVVGLDVDDQAVGRGREQLRRSTDRAVGRGRMSEEEAEEVLDRITWTTDYADLSACGLVIEAVSEKPAVKHTIFAAVDEVVGADTVLATNTSSLSVTEIAAATSRPGRVVGMHFFNPAPVQKLVEVVHTVLSDRDVVQAVGELARGLGKTPVVCADRAGFIANALLFGYLNRAATLVENGFASREDIDTAMRVGCGYPMGPLALLDLIGLDTAHQVLTRMYDEGRNRLHAPAPILTQLSTAGLLGRKSGRGFYTYDGPGSGRVVEDSLTPGADEPVQRYEVRSAGVVGSGPLADALAEMLAGGDYSVSRCASPDGDLSDLAEADLVVDATEADRQEATELFARLDELCGEQAILASTTSTVPIVALAAATTRPGRVVGMHLVEATSGEGDVPLVEVVSTVLTTAEVAETARALCLASGASVVSYADRAGRLVDALLLPYLNDAVAMLDAGYATADDVDAAMTLGCALPVGPIAHLDRIGLDRALATMRVIFEEAREPGLAPSPLLAHLVAAGRTGGPDRPGVREVGD